MRRGRGRENDKFNDLEGGCDNGEGNEKKKNSSSMLKMVGIVSCVIMVVLYGLNGAGMDISDIIFGGSSSESNPTERSSNLITEEKLEEVAEINKASTHTDTIETAVDKKITEKHDSDFPPALPELPIVPGSPDGRVAIVSCSTTKGPLKLAIHEAWAPLGAARFLELVESNFFSTEIALFRAIKGWLVQFGVSGDPETTKLWRKKGNIKDDPTWLEQKDKKRFKRGMISFAGGGPNTRQTEMFIAYSDTSLGGPKGALHEVPFGQLIGEQSFQTLDSFYTGYGDIPAFGGHAPAQGKMYNRGLEYLKDPINGFPLLDYITGCNITVPLMKPEDTHSDHQVQHRVLTMDDTSRPPLLSLLRTPPKSITVLIIPSPVDPKGRMKRLKAAGQSWIKALREVRGMNVRVLPARDASELEKSDYEGFLKEEILSIEDLDGDNAARLISAYKQVYLQGADWLYAINDHTFLIPENLRCFLEAKSPSESLWLGHQLQENGGKASFVSGAAGYVLSRELLGRLLRSISDKSCVGSNRERTQPGLMMAKCIRQLHVVPEEVVDSSNKLPLLHVYGPARMVSHQFDKWWSEYRKNANVEDYTRRKCCADHTISFHYCEGAEQILLDDIVRSKSKYQNMTHNQRMETWPTLRQLGAYSYLLEDTQTQQKMWDFLINKLSIKQCTALAPRLNAK